MGGGHRFVVGCQYTVCCSTSCWTILGGGHRFVGRLSCTPLRCHSEVLTSRSDPPAASTACLVPLNNTAATRAGIAGTTCTVALAENRGGCQTRSSISPGAPCLAEGVP
jgi:hypothetical protein